MYEQKHFHEKSILKVAHRKRVDFLKFMPKIDKMFKNSLELCTMYSFWHFICQFLRKLAKIWSNFVKNMP